MRKIVMIIILASIVVGCKKKEQPCTTVLGLGTPYLFINEFMIGKVKEVKETLYWAMEEHGLVKKGNL